MWVPQTKVNSSHRPSHTHAAVHPNAPAGVEAAAEAAALLPPKEKPPKPVLLAADEQAHTHRQSACGSFLVLRVHVL